MSDIKNKQIIINDLPDGKVEEITPYRVRHYENKTYETTPEDIVTETETPEPIEMNKRQKFPLNISDDTKEEEEETPGMASTVNAATAAAVAAGAINAPVAGAVYAATKLPWMPGRQINYHGAGDFGILSGGWGWIGGGSLLIGGMGLIKGGWGLFRGGWGALFGGDVVLGLTPGAGSLCSGNAVLSPNYQFRARSLFCEGQDGFERYPSYLEETATNIGGSKVITPLALGATAYIGTKLFCNHARKACSSDNTGIKCTTARVFCSNMPTRESEQQAFMNEIKYEGEVKKMRRKQLTEELDQINNFTKRKTKRPRAIR